MTRRGTHNARPRGSGGRFQSQTAIRTIVDEHQQATVVEQADGSKEISTGPLVEVLADGTRLITAPTDPNAEEERELSEPLIFTHPTMPNTTLGGTLFKLGPGRWKQTPRRYLRFINGHCRVTTKQDAERIRQRYNRGKRPQVFEEPAPLLSPEDAAKRGLERPHLFKNGAGQIRFWTYHREAYEQFIQTFNEQHGI